MRRLPFDYAVRNLGRSPVRLLLSVGGSTLVVLLVLAGCIAPHLPALSAAITDRAPEATIVLREHTDDLRRRAVTTRRLDGRPVDPEV